RERFAQRIERPGIQELNPFLNRGNAQYITIGNPDLRPSVTNNFEFSYGNFNKGSITLSTNYSFANNTIQNVTAVDKSTGVTTTTFANIGKNRGLGFDANINYPITPKLNVNINAELLHVWLEGNYNGEFYKKKGFQGHMFTYTSYKFDNGYRLGLNLGFDSRYVLLQGTDNNYFDSGINVSKEVFSKKGTISLGVRNPFSQYIKLDYTYQSTQFRQSSINYGFYRSFNIGFNYKFGRLNSEIKKNQRGINNDDKSSGGKN
ncbi:MAG: TonB-dependent receptor, partial [Sphingobacteriaceae bacterium]